MTQTHSDATTQSFTNESLQPAVGFPNLHCFPCYAAPCDAKEHIQITGKVAKQSVNYFPCRIISFSQDKHHALILSIKPCTELLSRSLHLPLRGLPLIMNGILSPGSSLGPHSAVFCPHSAAIREEMSCRSCAGRLPVIGLPEPVWRITVSR